MNISVKYEFLVKYEIFVLYEKIRTLPKNSYFMIFILYQKIRTLLKYSYFTENFVLYQKIRTPGKQVLSCNPEKLTSLVFHALV